MVKSLPTMQETWVRSLGWEDPPEKDGNSPQYFSLENPRDGGAWQATVHGVTKSRTRLSDFTSLLDQTLKCSGKQALMKVVQLDFGETMYYEAFQSKYLNFNTGIDI